MPRRRDYAAEYRARQARSKAAYGVGYSQQRRLLDRAKEKGIPKSEVRDLLRQTHAQGRSVEPIAKVLQARETRADHGGRPHYDDYDMDDLDIPYWWIYDT